MVGDTDSMCAAYAVLIENELAESDPDMEKVQRLLDNIKRYCQTVGFEPGETPEHLEPHLFESRGSDERRDL